MGITKKQKAVYDFINNYDDANGLAPTQKEIKEHFGLKSFGSVQRYLKYLVDAGYLKMDWNARRGLKVVTEDESSNNKSSATEEIPLLGLIAAGNPIEAIENPAETIDVPKHMIIGGNRHFALTICGDSMIDAGVLENDIVVCKTASTARQGQIAVCVVNGEATLKHYYQRSDHIELRPANEKHSPIIITEGDFQIAGVLTGLVRYY
ncbi:MAG: transcriptional repressor LexA [Bacteriovoracaceae bacterium]|nr:transcriptional repressor LexA [Bacteriovoracaceae bacterium]